MLNARLNRTPISRVAGLAIAITLVGLTAAVAGVVTSAQAASASFSGSLVDAIGKILPETTARACSADGEGHRPDAGVRSLQPIPCRRVHHAADETSRLQACLPAVESRRGYRRHGGDRCADRYGRLHEKTSASSPAIASSPAHR